MCKVVGVDIKMLFSEASCATLMILNVNLA